MKIIIEDAPVHLRVAMLALLRKFLRRHGILFRESDTALTIINTERLAGNR